MRILAMSNIHGLYDEMVSLLELVNYNPEKDKLFILGGMVDYGPKSMEVVNKCIELQKEGAVILRGEREQLYINAFVYDHFPSEEKLANAKNNLIYFYLDRPEIREKHINFFKSLKFYTEYKNYVFSHAGIDVNNKDNLQYCLSNTNFYTKYKDIKSTDKTYVFGYVPVFKMNSEFKSELYLKPNMVGIDFGAARYPIGSLGIVILEPERRYWTISESK